MNEEERSQQVNSMLSNRLRTIHSINLSVILSLYMALTELTFLKILRLKNLQITFYRNNSTTLCYLMVQKLLSLLGKINLMLALKLVVLAAGMVG